MRILLISGSTRGGSGNTAALRTIQALAPDGVTAELYGGLAALPAGWINVAAPGRGSGAAEHLAIVLG